MNKEKDYKEWVDRVCSFMEEFGPKINRCTSVFQSKPILDKQPEVVFLGYNANENFPFEKVDRDRFYHGNSYFYKERDSWKVWNKLYGMFKWADYLTPMTDGNFVFMNAVYFGTNKINQFATIPESKEAISKCFDFTKELIQDIFKPKCIVCFSITSCFDRLNKKYGFNDTQTIVPLTVNNEAATIKIKKGMWENIPIYGIPHPSQAINYDNLGAIVLYLKKEMQSLNI